jgi:hypothetical protein
MTRLGLTLLAMIPLGCAENGNLMLHATNGNFMLHATLVGGRGASEAEGESVPSPVPPDDRPPPSTTFHVRAWADDDFRRRPGWRAHIESVVARASAYTQASFGAALEVDIQIWKRSGGSLSESLAELEKEDPGADVGWVVGFVGPAGAVTSDMHEIGRAEPFSKWLVLRSMNDADEIRELRARGGRAASRAAEATLSARMQHKELVVFLHEWAHTLGHPHEVDDTKVMNPTYSRMALTFSPAGVELLRASLASRRGGPEARTADGEVRALLASRPPGWIETEVEDLVTPLELPVRPAAAPAATAGLGLETRGPERPDGHPAQGAPSPDRASGTAMAAVQRALSEGAFGAAEALLAEAPSGPQLSELREVLVRLRRQTGLPRDAVASGVRPEDEPAVRTAFIEISMKLYADDVTGAQAIHRAARKRFPRALPLDVALCSIEAWVGHTSAARRICERVLSRWNELPLAHYWLGQIARTEKEKIAHHLRAIEFDETQEAAWRALARLYTRRGDNVAHLELRSRYRHAFKRELDE